MKGKKTKRKSWEEKVKSPWTFNPKEGVSEFDEIECYDKKTKTWFIKDLREENKRSRKIMELLHERQMD